MRLENIIHKDQQAFQFLKKPKDESKSKLLLFRCDLPKSVFNWFYIGLKFSHLDPIQLNSWHPVLHLPGAQSPVTLNTLEISPLKPSPLIFSLDPEYHVKKVLPRSFFAILYQCNIMHTFVFNLQDPESPFFHEISGMRQVILSYFNL